MRTYSHWLLTAALAPELQRSDTEGARAALLAGAVVPDMPLAFLTAAYLIDRRYLRPHLPDKTRCSPTYNELYFNNAWWIAAHNLLHAPLPVFLLGMLGYLRRNKRWGERLFWFALGCGLHTAVDIVTHNDDGPVLFFPLDWQQRFRSPLSYWDAAYRGRLVSMTEHLLDFLLAGYLLCRRR